VGWPGAAGLGHGLGAAGGGARARRQPAAPPPQALRTPTPIAALPIVAAARDSVILDMREAFRRGDKARLASLLPQARGHGLEPWAAYWALKARLEDASAPEVADFLARYAGTYQEDRLRNDWLLLLGKRRDWAAFRAEHARYRMRDDREVRCHAVSADIAAGLAPGQPRGRRGGAARLAGPARGRRRLPVCRRPAAPGRPAALPGAVEEGAPGDGGQPAGAGARRRGAGRARRRRRAGQHPAQSAPRYLSGRANTTTHKRQELATLALIRLATQAPDQAAQQLEDKWAALLGREERNWLWGVIGKWSALAPSERAHGYFSRVTREGDLSDDLLAWKVRAALRQGDWRAVLRGVDAMQDAAADDGAWLYWKARAQQALARGDDERAAARAGFERLAAQPGRLGFYDKLALEALGQPIVTPPAPAPLTRPSATARAATPA
jgi:soluble lytic murein transglycosylase